MLLRGSHIFWTLIICRYVSGDYVAKAVNDEATFAPGAGNLAPGTTSIIWKHRDNAGVVVKVIEWDQDERSTEIPNAKFKAHASLDKQTGELTLRGLQLQHSGVYTIDINSKEQRKQFTLTVVEHVDTPHITANCELGSVPVCSLICEGDASSDSTVLWQNSAGLTLNQRDRNLRVIRVTNSSNPDEFYTCTLENAVSTATSHPVYETELFYDSNRKTKSVLAILSIAVIILLISGISAVYCRRQRASTIRY